MPLPNRRVLVIQRLGDLLRVASGHRIQRAATQAVAVGGTVTIPIDAPPEMITMLRKLARQGPVPSDGDLDATIPFYAETRRRTP